MRRAQRFQRFRQELLVDEENLKITLQILELGSAGTVIDANTTLHAGSMLIWYLFPGEAYEIGAFYGRQGAFQGHYVNVIRPVRFEPDVWVVEDLYLDVWIPAGGAAVLLDEDDLEAAVAAGDLDGIEADEARNVAARMLRDVRDRGWSPLRTRRWPPPPLRRWPGDLVPALRLRRDSPGTFHAARISGRIIAYGLYLMGVVSATSIGFSAFTDAFIGPGRALEIWKLTIAGEALLLAPLALGGRLPATWWPRPPLTDERSLFVATLASGLAVLSVNERAEWGGALLPVYGVLGLFSLIFAVCRGWFDRKVPMFALSGVVITLVALWFLI